MSEILFSENSELHPVTKQKLVKLCETLKREQLTPWLWFNSRGVKVNKFDGGIISIQGGLYEESRANVFRDSIAPFLQDAIVKNLDETIETCRDRGLKPEEPYIRETAMLLDGYLIDPIYRYMADIDQRIRGKGNPKSVGRRNVTDEIAEMVKFLDKCKDEMIQGIKQAKQSKIEQNTTPAKCRKIWTSIKKIPRWIYFLIIFLSALLTIFHYIGWLEPIKAFIYKVVSTH
jgi:hypothetical protein